MNVAFRTGGVLACLGVAALAFWKVQNGPVSRTNHKSVTGPIRSAITNPVSFAKSHFTGGIGAILLPDSATGLPRVREIVDESPAQKAGLREGDCILAVDGVVTRGRTLAQNIQSIRGFAVGTVRLTIQRAGSTNLECVVHRGSWSSMGIPQ